MKAHIKAITLIGIILSTALPLLAQQALPAPWKDQDIGAAKIPGNAEEAAGVFTVQGTMDIWGAADGSHLAWQPGHGDLEIVGRVTAIENPGKVNHAKASLCIRESLDAGARQVTLCVTPGDGTQFIYRKEANAKAVRVLPTPQALKISVPKGQFPCWLKLVRHRNTFIGYESPDGEKWQVSGQIDLDLPPETVVGLAASSHKPDILTKVVFDHVTVSGQPTTGPTNR